MQKQEENLFPNIWIDRIFLTHINFNWNPIKWFSRTNNGFWAVQFPINRFACLLWFGYSGLQRRLERSGIWVSMTDILNSSKHILILIMSGTESNFRTRELEWKICRALNNMLVGRTEIKRLIFCHLNREICFQIWLSATGHRRLY